MFCQDHDDHPEGAVSRYKPLWFKFPRHIHTRPDVMAAGTDAVLVYLDAACLCFDAESNDGVIPVSRVPLIGRGLLVHADWNLERISKAIAACEATGLFVSGSFGVRLLDWDDLKPESKDAARMAAKRDAERNANEKRTESEQAFAVRSPEKSREEQSRAPWVGGGDCSPLREVLKGFGTYTRSPALLHSTADRLAQEGCTAFDLEDLWSEAKTGNDPAAVMASFLKEPGAWRRILEEVRAQTRGKTGPLYGEAALVTPGDPARSVDPDKVGVVWCDWCRTQAMGKHWVDHGPIGWRPGDPVPEDAQPPDAKPMPTAKEFKVLAKKMAEKSKITEAQA